MYNPIRQLGNQLRALILKALLKSVDDNQAIQLVKVALYGDEEQEGVERLQDYGLTSVPPTDSEALVVQAGGAADNLVCLKVDSAAHRPQGLADGEVAVYSQHGQKLMLNSAGECVFNDGSYGVARIGHQTISNVTVDPTFFAFLSAIAAALGLTAPASLTTQISQGSAKVKVDD